jgi:hypothetical protein
MGCSLVLLKIPMTQFTILELIDENIKNVVPVSFSFDLQDPFEQFFDKLWSWDVHSEVILWRCSIRKGDGALIGN